MLLVTAMPSEAEVLAMIPILWTERTAFPGQSHDTAEAKVQEIKDRCDLTGYTIRNPFDHALFKGHLLKIAQESQTVGMQSNLIHLRSLYDGTMTSVEGAEGEASSVSSKLYLIGPMHDDWATAYVKLNPMAKLMTQKVLEETISGINFKRPFEFEDFCNLMCRGGRVGGDTLTARARVIPATKAETSACILSLTDDKNEFVAASTSYPVLDFATSRHDWINPKVGSNVEVGSSAFVRWMVKDLCLARIVGHELQWKEGKKAKITLTFWRNSSGDTFRFVDNPSQLTEGVNFETLQAFFDDSVDVKHLDLTDWHSLARTKHLVGRYGLLIGKDLIVPRS